MAQRLIDDEGLARRTRSRSQTLIHDISVSFSRYEKMQEFGLIKIFTWKHLTIWRPEFFWFVFCFSQSTGRLIFCLHPELLSRGSWRSASCSGPDLIFVEAAGKGQLSVSRAPSCLTMFWGHFMVIVSHGVGKAHSQIWQIFHWQATQCVVTRPDLVSSKSLWTIPVLLTSWYRKIFPLVTSSHI